MLKKYLEIGQIVSTHGIRGELRVNPWCDGPEYFKHFKKLYFKSNGSEPVRVLSSRPHGSVCILSLENVDTVEKAQALKNKILYMKRDDAPKQEGKYFIQDLIGCSVIDADKGIRYGEISDVSPTGANDVWHIKGVDGKEFLIPAIPSVVILTDIENEVIEIRPLEGMFGDED